MEKEGDDTNLEDHQVAEDILHPYLLGGECGGLRTYGDLRRSHER